jgi:hypothetical protein
MKDGEFLYELNDPAFQEDLCSTELVRFLYLVTNTWMIVTCVFSDDVKCGRAVCRRIVYIAANSSFVSE